MSMPISVTSEEWSITAGISHADCFDNHIPRLLRQECKGKEPNQGMVGRTPVYLDRRRGADAD
jgi:hypothetical protein